MNVNSGGKEIDVINVSSTRSLISVQHLKLILILESESGVQVIVLGCLLGALIILFYTLQIVRCVLKRRKKPKEQKEK